MEFILRHMPSPKKDPSMGLRFYGSSFAQNLQKLVATSIYTKSDSEEAIS
ncbi:MAG: hypothetical protein NPIRA05_00320 [Nitrospirales bacterium]|nr:MAG: hypothetical protein NPIRA05_00320 [Nitrospirales bacterium]